MIRGTCDLIEEDDVEMIGKILLHSTSDEKNEYLNTHINNNKISYLKKVKIIKKMFEDVLRIKNTSDKNSFLLFDTIKNIFNIYLLDLYTDFNIFTTIDNCQDIRDLNYTYNYLKTADCFNFFFTRFDNEEIKEFQDILNGLLFDYQMDAEVNCRL